MRLKQNITLIILILILLSAIFTINTLNIINVPIAKKSQSYGGEIKVNNNQEPQKSNIINVEIIWDVSGSMWGKIDSNSKINEARDIIKRIVLDFPNEINLGLRIFGSQKSNNKEKSFLAVPLSQNSKKDILNVINKTKPSGKSPIALNLSLAGTDLARLSGEKHILLITDGHDTGQIMPSQVIIKLREKGIRTHIVQIAKINKFNQLQLKELAKIGNGKYFTYFEEEKIVPTLNLK